MKFTHQLKFNCVPEWKEHYINYTVLKKIIYHIAAIESKEAAEGLSDEEARHLLGEDNIQDTEAAFIKALDRQLADIISFFLKKESDLLARLQELELDVHATENLRPPPGVSMDSAAAEAHRNERVAFWLQPVRRVVAERQRLRQKITELFVQLDGLKEYLDINHDGLRKIIKKHDKVTTQNLRDTYWPMVSARYPNSHKPQLEEAIGKLADVFAVVCFRGDAAKAQTDLKRHLRDHVTFERNTVWRDMVAIERKATGAHIEKATAPTGKLPWYVRYREPVCLLAALVVFLCALWIPIFPDDQPEKQNCLALLAVASVLWSTEALPLFVTSMLVPALAVLLRVLVDRSGDQPVRMTAQDAAPAIFHAMFSQTIMLLLGGFAIAAALSKHFIAKQLAVAILSRVGRKPHAVLLAAMCVATFISMWISNVASPVLCFSILQPILRTLDPGHPFAKSLVMGIALAANLGGMTSPISSPQNIFAIERMSMDGKPPSWLSWFAVALPVSFVGVVICWAFILLVYRPWRQVKEVRPLKRPEDPITKTQVYVVVVSVLTVVLWCSNSLIQQYTGEMGVVAILPLVAFFGFGVLNKDDFNGFLWNVVMLAMGGLALGESVKSSGLLGAIAESIKSLVLDLDLWQVTVVFCALVLVGTSFISHTVGAMVILPIVQSVGEEMAGPDGQQHPKLLVMAAALMCSGAMGLPVSSFPNMNAVSLEDQTGQNYVNSLDFIKVGVPCSVFVFGLVITIGYQLMRLVNY